MMATVRLFDALPDFATQRPRIAADNQAASPVARGDVRTPQPDMGEIVRTEVARAEQALARQLGEEHEAALRAEREQHERSMMAQAEQLGEIASQMIAARFGRIRRDQNRLGPVAPFKQTGNPRGSHPRIGGEDGVSRLRHDPISRRSR